MGKITTVVEYVADQLKKDIRVKRVNNGYKNIPQENLPGKKTVVVEIPGLIGKNGAFFFESSGDKVMIPNEWKNGESNLTPEKLDQILIILNQKGYNVEYSDFFKK